MARRKKRSTAHSSSILPAWIWLTLGILIGLGIAVLTRINDRYAENTPSAIHKQQNEVTDSVSNKRSFDFYTLLPELEIVIPQEEAQPPQPGKSKKANPDYTGGYLLQAGSFQKYEEADSLKARLALIGIEARIQSVKVNNSSWHRVQIGPSNNRASLEALRKQLKKQNIDTLLVQAKN